MLSDSSSESTSSDEIFMLALVSHEYEKKKKAKQRKYWVHDIFRSRLQEGEFHTLFSRLKQDEQKFYKYFRMSPHKFDQLHEMLAHKLVKKNTTFRQSIETRERLTIFLRYLATGADFQTISFNFRIGHTTVHNIITETAGIIWETLAEITMPKPTEEAIQRSAEKFERIWNFPNCIAAIDGKHIVIQAPPNSGSLFFNYKKTFSIVLLAMVDAEYKFISVDVGAYGKNSDGGIFKESNMGQTLAKGTFGMPKDRPVCEGGHPLPYVIVGDEAFPAKPYLLRPYSGRGLSAEKKIFNYRLSRARRVSENAFGILCHKFRIFLNKLQVHPKNADTIVLASLCLHNFLRDDDMYLHTLLLEEKQENETVVLTSLPNIGGRLSSNSLEIRDKFSNYFSSVEGALPWQQNQINAGVLV